MLNIFVFVFCFFVFVLVFNVYNTSCTICHLGWRFFLFFFFSYRNVKCIGDRNALNKHLYYYYYYYYYWLVNQQSLLLTGQSWQVLKSWLAGGGPEQRFQHCFADRFNQSLVSPVGLAMVNRPVWKALLNACELVKYALLVKSS